MENGRIVDNKFELDMLGFQPTCGESLKRLVECSLKSDKEKLDVFEQTYEAVE